MAAASPPAAPSSSPPSSSPTPSSSSPPPPPPHPLRNSLSSLFFHPPPPLAPALIALDQAPPNAGPSTTTLYRLAVAGALLCPVLIALPPRKLDLYTFALVATTGLAANHVALHRTGVGLLEQVSGARRRRRWIVEGEGSDIREREDRRRVGEAAREGAVTRIGGSGEGRLGIPTTATVSPPPPPPQDRNILQRLWYGKETPGWVERRRREEEEALAEGKSYADLIAQAVWDVWSNGQDEEDAKRKQLEMAGPGLDARTTSTSDSSASADANEMMGRQWAEAKEKEAEKRAETTDRQGGHAR